MGLFRRISNALFNKSEDASKTNTNQADIKYPQLYAQCNSIYDMITNYEGQISDKERIEWLEKQYKNTKREVYFEMLEEAKYKLFIKPPVIKDLISSGRDIYDLSKEAFYDAIKSYFDLIATNKEFTPHFCFEYLKKEIDEHYSYYPIEHIDFKQVINECFFNKNSKKIEKSIEHSKYNKCPYCNETQESELSRSRKCCKCGAKIYVLKVLDKKLYLDEKEYCYFKEEQDRNKSKLDFCYMVLQCGVKEEELESYLKNGNINRINDFAWRKLSEYKNTCFDKGQIDMLSRININMAKILIYEKKYKTAIHLICESLYEDGSPIAFHPGHPYKEVDGKIQNVDSDDTCIYNRQHKPYLNDHSLQLISSLKANISEAEIKDEMRKAFEECTRFYLEKTPNEMYEEVVKELNL